MVWNPEDPIEKQKRIAWSVATSTAIQTKEDPVLIYERLMKQPVLMNVSLCDTNDT
jgi:hypothetical protein